MASQMWVKLALLAIGLLVMVPETMQLNVDHPLFGLVQKINIEQGPFLGLIISGKRDEELLKNSTYFTPDTENPSLTIAGRTFNFGTFKGVPTIYVQGGEPLANTGVTVEKLINTFTISGIINYGNAGTLTNQVFISNVVVPSKVVYTGSWTWQEPGVEVTTPGFTIGDYNLPDAGKNGLGSIEFESVPVYTPGSNQEKATFIDVDPEWYSLASQINYGERPTVVFGAVAGTSDIYLSNKAYGSILNSQLGVSTVDTKSAAIVTTAKANGIKSIVFRGASNRPGTSSDPRLSEVTSKNVLKTVAKFVEVAYPKSLDKYSIVN